MRSSSWILGAVLAGCAAERDVPVESDTGDVARLPAPLPLCLIPVDCYKDSDGDGFGGTYVALRCAGVCNPGESDEPGDCNDANVNVNPGEVETVGNNRDDNCDGGELCFANGDRDGYGSTRVIYESVDLGVICEAVDGEATNSTDCDDNDSGDYPGASEIVGNGDDESCDGIELCYDNSDGDPDGTTTVVTELIAKIDMDLICEPAEGESKNNRDCDDRNAAIYSTATEIPGDEVDQDCTGTELCYQDVDNDDYGAVTVTSSDTDCQDANEGHSPGDCDDGNATINPKGTEVCDSNDADEDCDGYADNEDAADGTTVWYKDTDADGYGTSSYAYLCDAAGAYSATKAGDCNDSNKAISPGATEVCDASNVDEDCDSVADNNDASATNKSYFYVDGDADTYGTSGSKLLCDATASYPASRSGDCDDANAGANPGKAEVCDSKNVDEDCDTLADNDDPSAQGTLGWYVDGDDDGFGAGSAVELCDAEGGYDVTQGGDCDDGVKGVNPGATEVCDSKNVDEDCDGTADNADSSATGKSTWYVDADSDAYGGASSLSACDATAAYPASKSGDCNDSSAAINPGKAEVCDASNVDENCSGAADDADSGASGKTTWYVDQDADAYGTSTSRAACDAGGSYTATKTGDCDDAAKAVNPGATEACDSKNVDEDCDGTADNADSSATGRVPYYADSDSDGYGAGSGVSYCDPAGAYVVTAAGDCNDGAKGVNPGATEVCDSKNIDEDCDSAADDADASASAATKSTWYLDQDGDGHGTSASQLRCDATAAYTAAVGDDCNDAQAWNYPGNTELCDSLDNDCDTSVDEGVVTQTYYQDADTDGYGVAANTATSCAGAPSGFASKSGDCNDGAKAINPGAAEVCDSANVDEDCDTVADNNDPSATGKSTVYYDGDNDAYGSTPAQYCDVPAKYVVASGDCNDSNANINPGKAEVCDGANVDEDCDLVADDADTSATGKGTYHYDADSDTFGAGTARTYCDPPARYVSAGGDCNDAAKTVNPGATEVCDSADVDENCNGTADNADSGATLKVSYYNDADRDTYGAGSVVALCDATGTLDTTTAGDCNDADAAIHPNATEICDAKNADEDCDGAADDADTVATGKVTAWRDADGDTWGAEAADFCDRPATHVARSGDCDDAANHIHPGATEVCDKADVDEDCDGVADNADPSATGRSQGWLDGDKDGYGAGSAGDYCDLPSSFVGNDKDCDDADVAVHPAAAELCDVANVDENCNGKSDDDDVGASGAVTWYRDDDLDGFGGGSSLRCDPSIDFVTQVSGDCDDATATIHPSATEVCNHLDDDCDQQVDEDLAFVVWYADDDDDGFGDLDAPLSECTATAPAGYVADASDCADLDGAVFPGAPEVPYDGVDQDCDAADLIDVDADGFAAKEAGGRDCADADPAVHPDAIEVADGVDQDCNGDVDDRTEVYDDDGDGVSEIAGDCDDDNGDVYIGGTEVCDGLDQNCDGVIDEQTECSDDDHDGFTEEEGDCNDLNPGMTPGSVEVSGNGLDDDCDGDVDEHSTEDVDGDGITEAAGDCAPFDGAVFPGATEVADGVDNDCDDAIDEGTDIVDDDGDGYNEAMGDCDDADAGVSPAAEEACDGFDEDCDGIVDQGTDCFDDDDDGYTEEGGDCQDADADVNPGQVEVENGADDDCDGTIDDGLTDYDGDGFSAVAGDCDDTDPSAFPGAPELCDGDDESCDGVTDEGCDDTAVDDPKGCACDQSAPSGVLGWLGVLGLMARRRRR